MEGRSEKIFIDQKTTIKKKMKTIQFTIASKRRKYLRI